jgi:hypothetical protein
MSDFLYVPVPRKLYNDVNRLSDGKIDLVEFSLRQFDDYISMTEEDDAHGIFGTRFEEFLADHYPDLLASRRAREVGVELADDLMLSVPLVWKEVVIPSGAQVRMQYSNAYHFAKVNDGMIEDEKGRYTPSEWASKIAAGTNRNAWRDLWFRFPNRREWLSATSLRDAAQSKANFAGPTNAAD